MTGLRLFYKTIMFTLQAGDVAEGTHTSVSFPNQFFMHSFPYISMCSFCHVASGGQQTKEGGKIAESFRQADRMVQEHADRRHHGKSDRYLYGYE